MNKEAVLFALLRIAVCGETGTDELRAACTEACLEEVYVLALKYDLAHLVGQGASKLNLEACEALNQCKQSAMQAFMRYGRMNYEYESVCGVLEAEQIPFIPLKGAVLRQWYPEPWMRTSCDMDILVHKEDAERASTLLQEKLHYTREGGSPHDISLYAPSGQQLELHYSLIEDFISDASEQILSGVWQDAKPKEGKQYHLVISDPLFYYYHIAHMAKHFAHGGCGIRPFVDIWILENRVPHVRAEREALLEKGGLLKFAHAAEKLSRIWLSGEKNDPLSDQLEQFLFAGGKYGGLENRVSFSQAKQGGKLKYALSRIFLPYDVIKHYYPVLQKHKILTPVYQVVRWFRLLFCGGVKRSVNELQVNAAVSGEKKLTAEELVRYLGI